MDVSPSAIVNAALAAATEADAQAVQEMIASAIGAENRRPLGDRFNNHGLMGPSGSFDLKLIENITNMQDAVIERAALREHRSSEAVPYSTPHEAAARFFSDIDDSERSSLVTVTFRESDPPVSRTKRLTPVFRDKGCGMTPAAVPETMFKLGGSHKEGALYLQGAFGLGGAQTFRNAKAIVLVTRQDPALLAPGEEDRVTVAVVQWHDNVKGRMAYYLVDQPWNSPRDTAEPWSCSVTLVPDFEPGTHLALISYGVEGFHRKRGGDDRSFDVVTNTRLFNPVLPVRFVNETDRADRATTLRGLGQRLDNTDYEFATGDELIPFNYDGATYQLPIRFTLFNEQREAGGRDKFVARDHTVVFTSNGQVHHHWTESKFKAVTTLNKLHKRIFIVVETDDLPILLRTSLFTSDRSDLVRGDAAIRLEAAVTGVIESWYELRLENNRLLREALRSGSTRPTAEIARRISRAVAVRGYPDAGGVGETAGTGEGRSGGTAGGTTRPIEVHNDPTIITGPARIRAQAGKTNARTFTVDVVDSFYDGRGSLRAICDHPDIEFGREITIGKGHGGRVRILIAVPDTAEQGEFKLTLVLDDWVKASGGLGTTLDFMTTLEIVSELPGAGTGAGKPRPAEHGEQPGNGGIVLQWNSHEKRSDWEKTTVGTVEEIPAFLAAENPDYKELASLGEALVPTIILNEDYPPLKKYLASRSKSLTTVDRPTDTYAVGTGVGLLLIEQQLETLKKSETRPPSDETISAMRRAVAQGVLAVMPSFDELAKEAGLDE